jgi:hypothetical protein
LRSVELGRRQPLAHALYMSSRYVFDDERIAPMCPPTPATAETDDMHAMLVQRADQLEGCGEGSPEEA